MPITMADKSIGELLYIREVLIEQLKAAYRSNDCRYTISDKIAYIERELFRRDIAWKLWSKYRQDSEIAEFLLLRSLIDKKGVADI